MCYLCRLLSQFPRRCSWLCAQQVQLSTFGSVTQFNQSCPLGASRNTIVWYFPPQSTMVCIAKYKYKYIEGPNRGGESVDKEGSLLVGITSCCALTPPSWWVSHCGVSMGILTQIRKTCVNMFCSGTHMHVLQWDSQEPPLLVVMFPIAATCVIDVSAMGLTEILYRYVW